MIGEVVDDEFYHNLKQIKEQKAALAAAEGSVEEERSEANAQTPIFQAHGELDAVVDPARGEAARDRLVELGYPHEWHAYPMGHQVCEPEIVDLARWFLARFQ